MSMVTVYNVKGQYIGFSCSLPSLCRYVRWLAYLNIHIPEGFATSFLNHSVLLIRIGRMGYHVPAQLG